MPYLNVLSKFRDEIRTDARKNKRENLFIVLFIFIIELIWLIFRKRYS